MQIVHLHPGKHDPSHRVEHRSIKHILKLRCLMLLLQSLQGTAFAFEHSWSTPWLHSLPLGFWLQSLPLGSEVL